MLTDLQRRAAQAIVNIFETGRARGDYGQVTVLAGDSGHLTYGRAQTTLASGNLFLLIKAYAEAPGAAHADDLSPYMERIATHDTRLDRNLTLQEILRRAGDDPVMHTVQDAFFDRVYWAPSLGSAQNIGVTMALGTGVVYDSRIHGSWGRMRDRTTERFGDPAAIGEKPWIERYIEVRRDWLATHSNALLQRTVYRMDALQQLLKAGRWSLELPFAVRGVAIDERVLTDEAASDRDTTRASAEGTAVRILRLETPRMRGDDIRALQNALVAAGFDIDADGVFGPRTANVVREFQQRNGLTADAIVGPATRAALDLHH